MISALLTPVLERNNERLRYTTLTCLLVANNRCCPHEYYVFKGTLKSEAGAAPKGYYRDAPGQMGGGGCNYEILFNRANVK